MRGCRKSWSVFGLLTALVIALGGVGAASAAVAGEEIFTEAQKLDDEALRASLMKTLKATHRRTLAYGEARVTLMGKLHLQQGRNGYYIKDVYCQKEFTAQDDAGIRPGGLPDDRKLNVEHTWPQSKFGGGEKNGMKSDLHHLFPSDSQMNAKRGNFKFGDVDGRSEELKCPTSLLGRGPDGGMRFEVPDQHKGNTARAIFYFAVRYNMRIDTDQETTLREWNHEDPVDQDEVARNAEIEKIQGNRNPFIDHPEFIDRISDF